MREVQADLTAALEPFATRPARLVGAGGTTTIMARILAGVGHLRPQNGSKARC